MYRYILILLLVMATGMAQAQTRIGVASNFESTAQQIADRFFDETGERVTLVDGSTGNLAQQIRQGTGFDAFLAGDRTHPEELIEGGIGKEDTLFVYGIGRLVLLADEAENDEGHGPEEMLREESYRAISLPDYQDSPYGAATVEVLDEIHGSRFGLRRTVDANTVAQSIQFMRSGSVDLGFVALSQVLEQDIDEERWWLIPEEYYEPLEQAAVMLEDGSDTAQAFLDFMREDEGAREIIRNAGYTLPDDDNGDENDGDDSNGDDE